MMVLKGLKGRDGNKGLKGRDGTEGVKGKWLKVRDGAEGVKAGVSALSNPEDIINAAWH